MKEKIIIDLDNTLLDYNHAYKKHWYNVFGYHLERQPGSHYSVLQLYNVPILTTQVLTRFMETFNENFWSSLFPLNGALEAIEILAEKYEIIGSTTSNQKYNEIRLKNLINLGFNIKSLISTGNTKDSLVNPKARYIDQQSNVFAVIDDHPVNLLNLSNTSIKKFLIARNLDDPIHPLKMFTSLNENTPDKDIKDINIIKYDAKGLICSNTDINIFKYKDEGVSPILDIARVINRFY